MILTSYNRFDSDNSYEEELSVAINQYNIHKKRFFLGDQQLKNKEGINFTVKGSLKKKQKKLKSPFWDSLDTHFLVNFFGGYPQLSKCFWHSSLRKEKKKKFLTFSENFSFF